MTMRCEYPQRSELRDRDKDSEKGSLSKKKMIFDSEKGLVGYKRTRTFVGITKPLVASKSKPRFNLKLYRMGLKARKERSYSLAMAFSPQRKSGFFSTIFTTIVSLFKLNFLPKLTDLKRTRSQSITHKSVNPIYGDESGEDLPKAAAEGEKIPERLSKVRCNSAGSLIEKGSNRLSKRYLTAPVPPAKDARAVPSSLKRKKDSKESSDSTLVSCESIYSEIDAAAKKGSALIGCGPWYGNEDDEESVISEWSDNTGPLID